jgi:hypothetical protein
MFAGYIVSNTYTFCLSITKSCFLNCLELRAKFMLKKLNYMYISMFLSVSRRCGLDYSSAVGISATEVYSPMFLFY